MENVQELAKTYRRILQLKNGPVAVRIIKIHEETPILLKKPENPIPSFCFGLMEAFKGKSIFLTRTDVRCAMGLTALGFRKESLKSRKHKHGVQIGVFGNEEASRNYFSKGTCLPAGQTKGVAMSPLEKAVMGVDVVLFKVNSEQAMWLLTANQYLTGERNDFHIGTGFHGVCEDVIVYPYHHKKVNMTVNGVGDRLSSAMSKNELFLGVPAPLVKKIALNLSEIYRKPIFKVLHSPKSVQKTYSSHTGPWH
ncbi:MAG: hypothetical protein A2Y79_06165 [Deltaproteobacteria bacterium RBG_13_43_22]|nr:MAG: hypothetical protein A2Y79_06165 [Deltaproteobacteria bacterium RBG_13_43_22]